MPKESRSNANHPISTGPYPSTSPNGQRNAAIWSSADDEILLRARASGLNWQPIASRNFPNKTANACRKRHERLVERRQAEDWDTHKLELLAQEYMACRKEMWEVLASRLGGERWALVEAKCMEKGLKVLQTAARTGQRRAAAESQALGDQGIPDHNSDSGIGLGSDAEGEVGYEAGSSSKSMFSDAHTTSRQQDYQEHIRSRSLPQMLPLYQPPAAVIHRRTLEGSSLTTSPDELSFRGPPASLRASPDSQSGRISIQSLSK